MKKNKAKKIISILLCVATVFMMPFATMSASAFKPGDVSRDNKITAADARLVLRYATKLITNFDDEQKELADVNGDGQITAADARLILRFSVRLILDFVSLQSVTSLENGLYFIRNRENVEYHLDVLGGSSDHGTKVQRYVRNGSLAQQWLCTKLSDGSYEFTPATNRSMRLDVLNGHDNQNQKIQIANINPNNPNAQRWWISESWGNHAFYGYRLRPKVSSTRVLSIRGGSSSPNDAVLKTFNENDKSQEWFFIKVTPRTLKMEHYFDQGFKIWTESFLYDPYDFIANLQDASKTAYETIFPSLTVSTNFPINFNANPSIYASSSDKCKGTTSSSPLASLTDNCQHWYILQIHQTDKFIRDEFVIRILNPWS